MQSFGGIRYRCGNRSGADGGKPGRRARSTYGGIGRAANSHGQARAGSSEAKVHMDEGGRGFALRVLLVSRGRSGSGMRGKSMTRKLDIAANRQAQKYGRRELTGRILWNLAQPLFRFSPRSLFAWRRWLLRRFGAIIGREVRIDNTVHIQFPWLLEVGDFAAIGEGARIYNLGAVAVGARVTISQFAHLCAGTHDYTKPAMPLRRLPIVVGDDAWICADAFIGPNVSVGTGAVVGARAAVFDDVKAWTVVGGNPARFIQERVLEEHGQSAVSGSELSSPPFADESRASQCRADAHVQAELEP